jgi:hypothetical protein
MPNLPSRGEAGIRTPPQVTAGEHRLTRARTAAGKNPGTQNAHESVSTAEVRPKKGNAEAENPPPDISPLHHIADSLSLLLGTEKIGSAVQKRIEKTIAYARDADAKEKEKEKDKDKTPNPPVLPDNDPLKLSIRSDLVAMYEALSKQLGDIQLTASSTLTNVNSLSTKASEISGESKSLAAKLGKVSECTDKIASSNTAYRDAVTDRNTKVVTPMAKLDPKVLGDMERRDKQIWLDLADDGDVPTLSKSLSALVEQANKSLDSIADQDKPAVVKVDAALKTRGGALILTLNSKEAALWLRRIEIEHAFTNSFSKGSSIRDRRFNIVVPRVPLIFEPDNLKHLRELEEVNGIEKHTFIKAKWIKPAARRRPDQTHAFMLLTALNAGAANIVIRDGLLICSTRVRPTKQKQEPMQCMKCRKWGHFASDCIAPNDTCGACGEAHRTTACTNKGKLYCVSCGNSSHPSWDRKCPEFARRCAIFDERNPENAMPYFPTGEDWTLAVRPNRIPVPERFPAKYAVNSLPLRGRSPPQAGKRWQGPSKKGKNNQANPNRIPVSASASQSRVRGDAAAEPPLPIGEDWRAEPPETSTSYNSHVYNTDEAYIRDPPGW